MNEKYVVFRDLSDHTEQGVVMTMLLRRVHLLTYRIETDRIQEW